MSSPPFPPQGNSAVGEGFGATIKRPLVICEAGTTSVKELVVVAINPNTSDQNTGKIVGSSAMELPHHDDAGVNKEKKNLVLDEDQIADEDEPALEKVAVCSVPDSSLGENEKAVRVEDDKLPRIGMVFRSYDEVCNFYKQYAMDVGFGVAVRKSSFTKSGICRRLILACSKAGQGRADACYQARQTAKTNCQAMIVLKSWSDNLLHLVEANLEHNHSVSPLTARFLNCYKKMTAARKDEPVAESSGHKPCQSDEGQSGNLTQSTQIGRLKLSEGDDQALYQFFSSMQNKSPKFFYLVDFDSHGRLKSLFWSDARSRVAYEYFGDVISFDTTFLYKKYDLPLVSFIGKNHHGQLVLLGCGLISDESIMTYIWLFRAFETCMLGCHPTAIITDQCKAIQDAVAEVFPNTRHGLCFSSMVKKIPDKLLGCADVKAIKKAIRRAAYDSLEVDQFENCWSTMVKDHKLEGNEWLNSLYDSRHLWALVFLKNTFWAGMSVSQCCEPTDTFFDGFVYPSTSLKQFLSKYETILQSKYKKEGQADLESHKTPLLISKFYMEEQLSKLYTSNMFRKFQDELKSTIYCDPSIIKVDGSSMIFHVRELIYLGDGKTVEIKDHKVEFNVNAVEVHCVCGSFELSGILCRHALSVLKFQEIYEFPPGYILARWKKDYRRLHALSHPVAEIQTHHAAERYDHLSMRCLKLAELGFVSDDRYQVALKLIKEVEKTLLEDVISNDRQPRLLSFESQSNDNLQNLLLTQLTTPNCSKTSDSVPMKRRGRPPKKASESMTETLMRSSKEQDFLRSSLAAGESNVLHSVPTSTHLDTHIGVHGGIDLMEDITANELSFGSHFSVQMNHQHHLGNQSRMQSSHLLQGQYDLQTVGSQSRMQWIYEPMVADNQIPREHHQRTS